jgi:hypothetical protein
MTAPALDKILTALRTALATALPTTLIEIDRPSDDEHGNAELPAINIVHQGTTFDNHNQSETLHTAAVDLDMLVATASGSTNASRLRVLEADLVAALWANRTLGGVAQDIRWDSSSGTGDVEANAAGRAISIEILFLTPLGDHRTILGAVGPVP